MTPTEEQLLINQVAIMGMLDAMTVNDASEGVVNALERVLMCIRETGFLLDTERQQSRTVHFYGAK